MKSPIVTGGSDRHAELPSLLKQAVVAHEAGKLDEAYPLYRQFLEGDPTHPMALHRFGLLHSQRGDYPTAIALMQESLRLFPGQPDVANWYRYALELQPHYIDAQRNLGLCQLSLEQVEAAISSFERCLEIDARDAVAWLCLGNARRRQDDLEAAIRCYETALELRPDYAEAHHNLGLCRRLQLQPRDALKHYEPSMPTGRP
jgi:tetratricopeptide (TPR) repeat protein